MQYYAQVGPSPDPTNDIDLGNCQTWYGSCQIFLRQLPPGTYSIYAMVADSQYYTTNTNGSNGVPTNTMTLIMLNTPTISLTAPDTNDSHGQEYGSNLNYTVDMSTPSPHGHNLSMYDISNETVLLYADPGSGPANGGVVVGSCDLQQFGSAGNYQCTATVTTMPAGDNTIYARFSGDSVFSDINSIPLHQLVYPGYDPVTLSINTDTGHFRQEADDYYHDRITYGDTYIFPTATTTDIFYHSGPNPVITYGSADTLTYQVYQGWNSAGCLINSDGTGFTYTGKGGCEIDIHAVNTDGNFEEWWTEFDLYVDAPAAVITLNSAAPVSPAIGDHYTPNVSSSSGNTVGVGIAWWTRDNCSVDNAGLSPVVTFTHAGYCEIYYYDDGNANFGSADEVSETVLTAQSSSTISTTPLTSYSVRTGTTYDPQPTNVSGAGVQINVTSASVAGACLVSQGLVFFNKPGTCTVTYSDSGTSDFLSSPDVSQTFNLTEGTAVITVPTTLLTVQSGTSFAPTATSSSGQSPVVALTTASPISACSIVLGTLRFNAPGTCIFSYTDAGTPNIIRAAAPVTQTFTVVQGQAAITVNAQPTQPQVGDTYSPSASSTSLNAVNVQVSAASPNSACVFSAGTVTFNHAGTCTVTYNDPGINNVISAAVQIQQVFTIAQKQSVIAIGTTVPATATVGSVYNPHATASVTLELTTTTPTVCTMQGTTIRFDHAGTCHFAFNDPGNLDYNAANENANDIVVTPDTAVITIGATQPMSALAGATYNPNASTNSGNAVTTTSSAPSVCQVSANSITFMETGSCTITYSDPGNTDFNSATDIVQQFSVTTIRVIYNKGTVSGTAPVDSYQYKSGDTVHVLGNFANQPMQLAGYNFIGWCTRNVSPTSCRGGTTYAPGGTFQVAGNTTLYPQWAKVVASGGGSTIKASCTARSVGTVNFLDASAKLTEASKKLLQNYVVKIALSGCTTVTLKGYTAKTGRSTTKSTTLSMELATQRTQVVRAFLSAQFQAVGIKLKYVLVPVGYKNPIATNATEAGRIRNRRVEISVSKLRK